MIDQIGIAILGPTALFASQTEKYAKYGCIIGLFSQPFWFYATYVAAQWGMFAICFFYLAAWIKGFHTHWWREDVPVGG